MGGNGTPRNVVVRRLNCAEPDFKPGHAERRATIGGMTTISANMIDEIFTLTSADITTSGGAATITLVAADPDRRPFVCYVHLDPTGGSPTMDCKIGSMVVAVNGDLYAGLVVGNKNDAVTISTTGADTDTFRYVATCGYLRGNPGNNKSGVQNS